MKILRKQKGQALFLGMVLMAVSAATVFVMYNTSQMATEKSRLVNAADGAAYSGAVWAARNLNFMAYTNRAMVANHVAVGHYVSYVSWIRYVEQAIDNIEDIGKLLNVIPGGQVVHRALALVERGARITKQFTERFAPIFITASDALNLSLSGAQTAAYVSMATHAVLTPQAEIMKAAASAHDNHIRVNATADMRQLRGLGVGVDLASETRALNGFIKQYRASRAGRQNDSGRMVQFSRQSYGASKEFITNRNWRSWILVGEFKKSSRTTQRLGRRANWTAEDTFEYKWPGGKWQTLARKRADARQLNRGRYTGVDRYFDVENTRPNSRTQQEFTFTAYATMPVSQAKLSTLMGLNTTAQRLAALSRAEIHYARPTEGFRPFGRRGEYANVFNPFWEARLTEPPREMLRGIL